MDKKTVAALCSCFGIGGPSAVVRVRGSVSVHMGMPEWDGRPCVSVSGQSLANAWTNVLKRLRVVKFLKKQLFIFEVLNIH